LLLLSPERSNVNWMIDYIECENYIRIICEDIFSIADLPAQCESLLAHRSWKQNIGLFFDFRNFDFGKMDIGVSRMILSQYEQVGELFGYGKVALLMNSTLGFGLAANSRSSRKIPGTAKSKFSAMKQKPSNG
jgi:hypothetical protein